MFFQIDRNIFTTQLRCITVLSSRLFHCRSLKSSVQAMKTNQTATLDTRSRKASWIRHFHMTLRGKLGIDYPNIVRRHDPFHLVIPSIWSFHPSSTNFLSCLLNHGIRWSSIFFRFELLSTLLLRVRTQFDELNRSMCEKSGANQRNSIVI